MDNLEETDKFLETYSLPKLNQQETDNLNTLITTSKIDSYLPFSNSSKRLKRGEHSPNHFIKPTSSWYQNQRHYKKRQLQLNISDTCINRCKNPHQNVSKSIQQHIKRIIHHDQFGFITRMVQHTHINQSDTLYAIKKDKSNMSISIKLEKAVDKI